MAMAAPLARGLRSVLLFIGYLLVLNPVTASASPLEKIGIDIYRPSLADTQFLIYDHRPPPPRPHHFHPTHTSFHLDDDAEEQPTAVIEKRAPASPSSTLLSAGGTTSGSSFPIAFDTSLGSNFTAQSCPKFISGFLNNPQYKSCRAVSMLLETSTSFFDATRSLASITQVLDTACAADMNSCTGIMYSLANQLIATENCETDYLDGNPIVMQAYNAFNSYEPVYRATCLKDSSPSQSYCFADSVTNKSNPTTSYTYYLPIGVSLPGGAVPSCSECQKQTMALFATYATNGSQPISKTYGAAASTMDMTCGPSFANKNVKVIGAASATRYNLALACLCGLLSIMFLA